MKALIAILLCGIASGFVLAQEPPQQAAAPAPEASLVDANAATVPSPTPGTDTSTAIPEPYRDDRYQTTWAKNPFLIKVAATVQTQASFAEDWELKGIMERGGVQTAILGSKKDPSQFKRVGPNPDAEGFQLIKASPSRNRKDAKVEVAKGGETATFTFSETPTMPQAPGRPGIVPGQPAPRVPMPNVPGKPVGAVNGVPQQQQPGAVPAAPPSAVQRRRVLIPSPVPAANP